MEQPLREMQWKCWASLNISPAKTLCKMCHEEWVANGFWPISIKIAATTKYPWSSVLCPGEFSWKMLGLYLMLKTAWIISWVAPNWVHCHPHNRTSACFALCRYKHPLSWKELLFNTELLVAHSFQMKCGLDLSCSPFLVASSTQERDRGKFSDCVGR